MHELSIAEGIIEIVERTANANHVRHVKTVRVSIGELAGVDIPSLEFAWQSVRKGGVAQNAELEIERPNGEAWCLQCQKNIPLTARPPAYIPKPSEPSFRFTKKALLKIAMLPSRQMSTPQTSDEKEENPCAPLAAAAIPAHICMNMLTPTAT